MIDRSIITCLCGRVFRGENGDGIVHRDEKNPFICPCGLVLFYDEDQWKAKSLEGNKTCSIISLGKLNRENDSGR